ncbi:MAG: zinc-finger domain-containing protein [Acidiphilium sp. 37-67-22]|nr:MAG: zinc-finger domain-containing protein [Acidiphilium sp. 21-66-27]OYW09940.1 MAG: zinc-finger domain-containing protein [Acidiphilium sp. 37-67-22]HQT73907.1 zinc-finger domain-containing protein [Acidiphilium sp.]
MADTRDATGLEPILVHERVVACDGGGGPLGHPRVYLKIEGSEITCPYCSRHYRLAGDARPGAGQ